MKVLVKHLSLRLLFFYILIFFTLPVFADTYTVTNNSDSGPGSLRQAILDANANPGADFIIFDAAYTITLDALSLTITEGNGDQTTIDGDVNGDDVPDITITTSANISGLVIEAANCDIRSLHMRGFNNASRAAILVDGPAAIGNTITGCRLGVTPSGNVTDSPNHSAIMVDNGASGTNIGDGTIVGSNVIGGNSFGIRIRTNSPSTEISGNYIGIGLDGTSDVGNSIGIDIFNSSSTSIGKANQDPNVISYNNNQGIRLQGSASTTIVNNYIGTDKTGLLDRGNGIGLEVHANSDGTVIGGDAMERNIITGSTGRGIDIDDSNNVKVMGNYIGLGSDGSTIIPNGTSGPAGIDIQGTSTNTEIGDPTGTNPPNVISGNGSEGIQVGASTSTIVGNYIGTDAAGLINKGNSGPGILLLSGGSGTIGGTSSGLGNVIGGNNIGISISADDGYNILGNYIGTDNSGNLALANTLYGIYITGTGSISTGNLVGNGTTNGANVISGNGSHGVYVHRGSGEIYAHQINGNIIGLGYDGSTSLGNGGSGVYLGGGARSNVISNNTIANNTLDGVTLDRSTASFNRDNTVSQNSTYNNGGKAISLLNGANSNINTPTITWTTNGEIRGENAAAGSTIEIFADMVDESQQLLASITRFG